LYGSAEKIIRRFSHQHQRAGRISSVANGTKRGGEAPHCDAMPDDAALSAACPVCMERMSAELGDARVLVLLPACDHPLCLECVGALHRPVCPTCRAPFDAAAVRPASAPVRALLAAIPTDPDPDPSGMDVAPASVPAANSPPAFDSAPDSALEAAAHAPIPRSACLAFAPDSIAAVFTPDLKMEFARRLVQCRSGGNWKWVCKELGFRESSILDPPCDSIAERPEEVYVVRLLNMADERGETVPDLARILQEVCQHELAEWVAQFQWVAHRDHVIKCAAGRAPPSPPANDRDSNNNDDAAPGDRASLETVRCGIVDVSDTISSVPVDHPIVAMVKKFTIERDRPVLNKNDERCSTTGHYMLPRAEFETLLEYLYQLPFRAAKPDLDRLARTTCTGRAHTWMSLATALGIDHDAIRPAWEDWGLSARVFAYRLWLRCCERRICYGKILEAVRRCERGELIPELMETGAGARGAAQCTAMCTCTNGRIISSNDGASCIMRPFVCTIPSTERLEQLTERAKRRPSHALDHGSPLWKCVAARLAIPADDIDCDVRQDRSYWLRGERDFCRQLWSRCHSRRKTYADILEALDACKRNFDCDAVIGFVLELAYGSAR
jgi:hypothetical protein